MNNIVLCGFMGCGKSTVGKNIARKSGRKFLDMDSYIEEKAGMTVSEIFEKYGEEKFRDMEHDACVELAGLVFLDVPLGIIKSRLKNDTTRPLLQRPDRDRVMKDLYDSRYPIYHAAADIVVKGKNTPLKTAFAIIDAVSGTDVAEKPHKNA